MSEFSHPKKVAFLFLTIENPNFPEIWEKYFRGHEDKYSIYVHPKHPATFTMPPSWKVIDTHVETAWGRITGAYFELFKEAMKDTENVKFVTISESCLPLRNFDEFYSFLMRGDVRTSYIRFFDKISGYDIGARIQTRPGYKTMGKFVKHYARFCVSRYHLEKLFKCSESAFTFFKEMPIGDEFFWTMIHPTPGQDYIQNYEITFDNWDYVENQKRDIKQKKKNLYSIIDSSTETEYNKTVAETEMKMLDAEFNRIAANPWSYKTVSPEDIQLAQRSNSFFWRKFPVDSNIADFYRDRGGYLLNERGHSSNRGPRNDHTFHRKTTGKGVRRRKHKRKTRKHSK